MDEYDENIKELDQEEAEEIKNECLAETCEDPSVPA